MIQTKLSPSRLWLLIATIAGLCTSCLDITDSGGETSLPDGKYPITFTATVDGLTVSRAAGKDAWAKDDPIAVSLNESSDSKTYKITDASNGTMQPVNPSDVYYWKTNTEELKILAWYPAEAVTAKDISDQSQGFADFDYLKAETTAKFSATGAVSLSFVHQMAKVTCTLTTDNSTTTDITKATVSIYGYTKASFAKGIVGKVENSNGWITPTTDKEVLVVPQDMKGQQFIRVAISGREYFYTPGENDPDLEAGKRYDYTIKVNEKGLESVTINTYPSWTEGSSAGGGEGTEATFHVHLPADHGLIADNITGATQVGTSNVYEISNHGNTFSISYTVTGSDPSKGYLISKGIGNCKRTTESDGKYTFTYSNIRSDIWLSYAFYSEVGYYYYSDGTCSPDYNSGTSSTCIGIVFKVGAGEGDNASNYTASTFTDDVIHGYAVALKNTGAKRESWGNISSVTLSTDNEKFYGYSNTQAIKKAIDYSESNFRACYNAVNYTPAAPANSSGWYLPSLGEYNALWQVYDVIRSKFTSAGGTDMQIGFGFYWTSSKKNSSAAFVDFGTWNVGGFMGSIRTDDSNAYVRPVLTF
jgi:hypothetical protein